MSRPPDKRDKLSDRLRQREPKMQSAAFPHAFLAIILCLSVKKKVHIPTHTPPPTQTVSKAPTHTHVLCFVLSSPTRAVVIVVFAV